MARDTKLHRAPRPSPFTWLWEKRKRLKAVARVLAYCFVVSLVLGGLALRSAYGNMKESVLIIGRQLSQFQDLTGGSYHLMLNGEAINVASAMTDQPVKQVLDRFQTACEQGDLGLADQFKRLPAALKKKVEAKLADKGSRFGIMRKESADEGMVACLVQRHDQQKSPVAERLRKFAVSGDLGDLGLLRYAYAKRTSGGRTHVITSWTDGAFHVFALAPLDGSEAPGTDAPHVGRPTGAKRLLSAEIAGTPHSVRVYDCPSQAAHVLSGFDQRLPHQGWTAIPFVAKETPNGRAYSRQGVDMLVFATPDGDHSLVSIVETRSE